MLKDFDKDLADLDLDDSIKQQLIEAANKRAGGLISKNEELLGKVSKLNTKNSDEQSATERLAALEANIEQERLTAKGNYDEALSLTTAKYDKTINELTDRVNSYEAKEREFLIDTSIRGSLKEVRVNPLHEETVMGFFKAQATVTDGKAMIGDKSLSDAINDWSESDSGKASRLAPDNSGGNANGGNQNLSGSGKNMTDAEKRAADINKRFGK